MEKTMQDILKMKECGCRKDIMETYFQAGTLHDDAGKKQCLKKYKQELEVVIDKECKSIDCIDYLIYEIEKAK